MNKQEFEEAEKADQEDKEWLVKEAKLIHESDRTLAQTLHSLEIGHIKGRGAGLREARRMV